MLKDIIKKIRRGLTGDFEHDYFYLDNIMDQYIDQPNGEQVIAACEKLLENIRKNNPIYDLNEFAYNSQASSLEEWENPKFNEYVIETIQKDVTRYYHALETTKEYNSNEMFSKALQIIEPWAKKIDSRHFYDNYGPNEYYSFNEHFEEILYTWFRPGKRICNIDFPYSDIYFIYGNILFELERYEEAWNALNKSLRWNPMNTQAAYEKIELLKRFGDIEGFFAATKDLLVYLFKPQDLGRFYRNLAYYFVEKQEWTLGRACSFASLNYDPKNNIAISEINYIEDNAYGLYRDINFEEFSSKLKEYDIDLEIIGNTIDFAYSYADSRMKDGEYDYAAYMYRIVYGLTLDEDVIKLIKKADAMTEKENLN